jgi:NAD(P)-dependent dehydrogenase (short-subunit alcohol dehydrogenase family)
MTIDPPRAVATAGDSGFGRSVVVALADTGMDVALTWQTDEEGAARTAKEVERLDRRAVTVPRVRQPEVDLKWPTWSCCDRLMWPHSRPAHPYPA